MSAALVAGGRMSVEQPVLFATHLPPDLIAIRLGAAGALGFIIGLERELKERPAGLRTHMMVSLAAAIFALITLEMMIVFEGREGLEIDPVRMVEAVTAGVAFLAAGTIIQRRASVTGLTTGAGMWLAGAVGLACGTGALLLAIIGTLFAIAVLLPMRLLERKILMRSQDKPEKTP
jgi:putative Mg2+ transporter-C (MgtC) family protein